MARDIMDCETVKECFLWAEEQWPGFWKFSTHQPMTPKEITSLSKSSIYRLISEGDFPKQIQIGKRSVVWVRSDINNWINQKLNIS